MEQESPTRMATTSNHSTHAPTHTHTPAHTHPHTRPHTRTHTHTHVLIRSSWNFVKVKRYKGNLQKQGATCIRGRMNEQFDEMSAWVNLQGFPSENGGGSRQRASKHSRLSLKCFITQQGMGLTVTFSLAFLYSKMWGPFRLLNVVQHGEREAEKF